MSTLAPPSTTRHPDRAPPPSLFLGPPSRNTSAISLSLTSPPPSSTTPQNRDPLLRTRSTQPTQSPLSTRSALESKPSFIRSRIPNAASHTHTSSASQAAQSQSEDDRTDALWAEMQATLAEVELNAFSSTHVFGAAHSAALEELRGAQVELARAWGRNEGDDGGEERGGGLGGGRERDKEKGRGKGDGKEEDDGEEGDILAARKRREANEKFFRKVQEGVEDVVGRLETVARAMGRVERESREIWSSGSESLDTGSITS